MKVLVLCGKKQSGKSTTAKFLYGREMVRLGIIETFNFNEDGDLLIPTETGWRIFNIYDKSYEFSQYANQKIWPHIKVYSFADKLKMACYHIFGLPIELMYGSDEDKATPTNIVKHYCVGGDDDHDENLVVYYTVREILQDFGTKVREIDPDAWANRVCEQIPERLLG